MVTGTPFGNEALAAAVAATTWRDVARLIAQDLQSARMVAVLRGRPADTAALAAAGISGFCSPSRGDRGQKREHYQQIASLREYVLIAQDKREIEVHARDAGGVWQRSVHRAAQTVGLPSPGIQFTVDELYNAAGVAAATAT